VGPPRSGTTDKTVKRVNARHEAGGDVAPPRPRERNYDDVVGLVAERVEKTKGRISGKRLLAAARAAGHTGSARNFRRLVATQKVLWRQENHRGRRPAAWSPGQYLVIDWGDRLGWRGAAARVLRGAGVVSGAVRALRGRPARGHDPATARIGALTPPGQLTAAAPRSMSNRSLLNKPPAAVGVWVLQRSSIPACSNRSWNDPVP
jgi:hypothetical protein